MSHESFLNGKVMLCCGDSLHFLRDQPDNRYDSIVTDPPYALVSITKRFGVNGAAPVKVPEGGSGAYARASAGFMGKKWDTGETAFAVEFWEQCLRVLKPGGHVVAFGGTRTYHRLACAVEDGGFEIRDQFAWTYGTGFNKKGYIFRDGNDRPVGPWGGAVKPAWEPICVGRKDVIGTVADNIRKYGTGAFNIDGCRIGSEERINAPESTKPRVAMGGGWREDAQSTAAIGRWPANIVHDGSEEVIAAFPIVGDAHAPSNEGTIRQNQIFGTDDRPREFHAGFSDAGSAARFFYTAKADSDDRLGSRHPTVKPVDLMQWLVRLVTPKYVPYCFECEERTNYAAFQDQPAQADSRETMRGMRDRVLSPGPKKKQKQEVLQQAVQREIHGEESTIDAGVCNIEQRLSPSVDAESPASEASERLHIRASLGGSTEHRSAADCGRSGSSHQRGQDGQSPREPSTYEKDRARRFELAKAEHTTLSALRGSDNHQSSCQVCGANRFLRRGLVLDPFAGTGTTGEACYREGMRCMLIERETEYQADIRRRMALVKAGPAERSRESIKEKTKNQPIDAGPLFDTTR